MYTLRQLCATLGRVQFILPHLYPAVQYEVYSQEPQLSIQPLTGVCVCVTERVCERECVWCVCVRERERRERERESVCVRVSV